jgi:hypothetical protein
VISGKAWAVAAIAAACALAAGCAAERVAGLNMPASRPSISVAAGAAACPFTVKSIEDRRDDKSLGQLIRTKVSGDRFDEWFANGLASIPGHTADGARVEVRVEVLKAYIHGLSTLKSANLVARVSTSVDGGAPRVTTYRGVDGSTNWNSSESEVQEAFDRALNDLQRQIGADLSQSCKR